MSDLNDIVEALVGRASGGEAIEAYAARGTDTEIRIYNGEIETLGTATSAGIGIRVLLESTEGSRVGFAWTGSLDDAAIDRALDDARENATFASPDPAVVFASPDGVSPASVTLADPAFGTMSIDDKVSLVTELEAMTRAADSRLRHVDAADYGDGIVEVALASTTGISAEMSRTSAYVSVAAIAGDASETQTGSGFSVGRGPSSLDIADASRQAVERSVRMLGAVKAPSARTTVVFDARVASTVLGVLGGALSGEAVAKGRSFFEGRQGEPVAVSGVTLIDDPTDARAYGAAAVDGEGLACRRNVLIDDGVLAGFVYDATSAKRAGTVSTGSAVRGGYAGTPSAGCRALVLSPGDLDLDGVLAAVGNGVYVQSITGVHSGVSPVSGDFSVGAEGLMIRDGALAEPFREVTVASTLQRMLLAIIEIGADLTWLPGSAVGQTLAIGDFQLSGS